MFNEFFLQAFIYLSAAVLAVPVARRLGLGSALGYLIAGVIIGPYLLGLVGEEGQDVMHFAEFGVVLMMFLVGLELEPAVLWRMRVPIIGLGGLQVVTTAGVIALIAAWWGFDAHTAIAVGLIVALSSTAIVLQTLEEKGWMKTAAGQRSFSVLLFQDIAVIPILALMPFLAVPGMVGGTELQHAAEQVAGSQRPGWLQGLLVLGVVAGFVLAGRFLTRPLFHYIARTRSQEIFMATALLLVVGITLLMYAVGLSPALGTFLAGVVLAESEFRHELEANIEPFKGLLLGLFFIAVGASIDFQLVASQPLLIFGLVFGLMAVKFVVLLVLGRIFRLALADNLMFAFALAQGGEFAFLLVSFALQNHALEPALANMIVLVVVLSMVLTPLVIIGYEKFLQPRLSKSCAGREDDAIEDHDNKVIIAGYGRFGQIVSRLLKASGYESTLLDHDAGQIEFTGRFGHKVFYGDAARAELLQAAGAGKAKLLVIAIDDKAKAVSMIHTAKTAFPNLKLLVRAYDRSHAYELIAAGADYIVRETFGSALALGEEALKALGVPAHRARRMAQTFEQHDNEGMMRLYEVWGDEQAYGLTVRENLENLRAVLEQDARDQDAEEAAAAPQPD